MSYDASAQTLRCPFCGSEKLDKDPDAKVLSPKFVLPFAIEQERVICPGDLRKACRQPHAEARRPHRRAELPEHGVEVDESDPSENDELAIERAHLVGRGPVERNRRRADRRP